MKRFLAPILAISLIAMNTSTSFADEMSCAEVNTQVSSLVDEVTIFAAVSLTQSRSPSLSEFAAENSAKYRSVVRDLIHASNAKDCNASPLGVEHQLRGVLAALNEVAQHTDGSNCEAKLGS